MRRLLILPLSLVTAVAGAAAGVASLPHPHIGSCPVFPVSSAWNTDISRAPVDPRSSAYVSSIGGDRFLHPDFGSGRYGDYGIPITVVGAKQRKVAIHFTAYGDESDRGPYPIPRNAKVEGGSDRHVLVVRQGECRLYELYDAHRRSDGSWDAQSGAVFNLRRGTTRPAGWTSADAGGLPIAPGLLRADEVLAGYVGHAIRVTVPRSQRGYVAPARHQAGSSSDPSLPPMGLRLRLKASYDISGLHGQAHVIAVAMRHFGLIVADNGSSWFFQGTPDRRWNDDDLDQLKSVPGSAFEAVQSGPISH